MKPRIQALTDEQAPAAAKKILEQTQRAVGMVPNLHRTLANAPAALRGYADLARALAGGSLPPALREQIALATASLNRCAYCASAHTAIGKGAGLDEDELTRNLGLESEDPATRAVFAFVRELVEKRGDVSDATLQAVRDAGFGDEALVEITAHVGLNTLTNLTNVLARTAIDFPVVELGATA